jgi:hypothetical protein
MSLVLNGTDGLSDVDGSAATPAIRGTDANTGIFFPGADRIGFSEGGVQVGEFDSSGNFQMNSGYGSVATVYGCRAWVNFNGTGTVAIRASGNVSSITDNGAGDYTVNFTTAMPDANYSVVGVSSSSAQTSSTAAISLNVYNGISGQTTAGCRVVTCTSTGFADDRALMNVAVFR